MKFGLLATGYKGFLFLKKIKSKPCFVVTYDNKERRDSLHYNKIIELCQKNDIQVFKKEEFSSMGDKISLVDKIFVVGWQFLIKENLDKIVVFHDSYLPERRGFSPTLSILFDGAEHLGASCFLPKKTLTMEPDYGLVYYRRKQKISYPITLRLAFNKVADMYVGMAHDILKNNTVPKMINYDNSSFSIWRDATDLRIDWTDTASKIQQRIFALGYPYMGASTLYDGQLIHIERARRINDVNIVNRAHHYGKIWKIENGNPYVICGKGIIKICRAKNTDGKTITFNRMRKRFI